MFKALRKTNETKKRAPLPKGFKAAAPIKSKKLRKLLTGPDITTSGGLHTFSDGQPLLDQQRSRR